MIEYRRGDILKQLDLTHLVHQCNLFGVFGSGIAAQIKKLYPAAYAADLATVRGDKSKLGTYSAAAVSGTLSIVNLYSQIGISATQRTTDYWSMERGFERLGKALPPTSVIGVPYKIGCGLAGGSWSIVEAILKKLYNEDGEFPKHKLVICRRDCD